MLSRMQPPFGSVVLFTLLVNLQFTLEFFFTERGIAYDIM